MSLPISSPSTVRTTTALTLIHLCIHCTPTVGRMIIAGGLYITNTKLRWIVAILMSMWHSGTDTEGERVQRHDGCCFRGSAPRPLGGVRPILTLPLTILAPEIYACNGGWGGNFPPQTPPHPPGGKGGSSTSHYVYPPIRLCIPLLARFTIPSHHSRCLLVHARPEAQLPTLNTSPDKLYSARYSKI